MKHFRSISIVLLAVGLAALTPIHAQNRTQFVGNYSAADYAYGVQPGVAALQVFTGNTSTGSQSITLSFGNVTLADGVTFMPLSTSAPITIGYGSSQETVTPSAVSCLTPAVENSCTFTATFAYTHGRGDQVRSGTTGLQEAVNYAYAQGGGSVTVTQRWAAYGGTNTIIAAAAPYSSVFINDQRPGSVKYWSMQPSTLTSLAVPTTLSASTVTFSGTGTWTAAAHYLCVTYVDALGGEGPCSATYNTTPSANTALTITAPAASTGAVGWRAYAGASYNGAYLLPITSTACTLTTLETVMPACAIGSNGTWTAIFLTTTTLRPNAQSPTINLNLPMPQGHTTFAYQPSGSVPVAFQTAYGPFPAFGSTTSGQVDVIGSVSLPTGYLNTIGRSVRISGRIALTANTAAVPTLEVLLGWVGGTTAGAPVAVCTNIGAAYGSTAAFSADFSCTITTNATGSSAATAMPYGLLRYSAAAGGTAGVSFLDTGTAAISSLGLSQQDTVYIRYTSGTNTTSAVQLLSLNVETLQ